MAANDDRVRKLQGFVDSFAADAAVVRAALADAGTPEPARRVLVGALNYVLDALDIFPDHYKGLGLADDALVFRAAAAQAVAAGAKHADLATLAGDKRWVDELLGELSGPFDKFVAALPERPVRGRSATEVLTSKDARAFFEGDLGRELGRHKPSTIEVAALSADGVINELKKMTRHALKRAGLVS